MPTKSNKTLGDPFQKLNAYLSRFGSGKGEAPRRALQLQVGGLELDLRHNVPSHWLWRTNLFPCWPDGWTAGAQKDLS
eukprot:1347716-Amphidinium_carterae.2